VPERRRAHVWISGRVQGVGFRYATASEARAQGVDGWVRNLDTGQVEAVFEGPAAAVGRLVAWCRAGPDGAWVREVRVDDSEPLEFLTSFDVRASGAGWPRR
jgi:acylphosphatase